MNGGYMKLGLMLDGGGRTGVDWMHPDMPPYPGTNFERYKEQSLIAEDFRADFVFVADTVWADQKSPPHRLDRFEAMTVLAGIAAVTKHIGVIGTLSTTFCEPYNIARQVLSLDHMSGGRAGWNLVTTDPTGSSDNFGRLHNISHQERYEMGEECFHIVTHLWDSFEDDALPQEKDKGLFLVPEKLHTLDHKGKYFEVKGPLNLHRSVQGRPIVFTATASATGAAFAARCVDCIFTSGSYGMHVNQTFYRDVKSKAAGYGRDPKSIAVMPGISPLIAPTKEAAREIQNRRKEAIGVQGAITYLSGAYHGFDIRKYDLDEPFPLAAFEKTVEGMQGDMMNMLRVTRDEGLTVRQFAMRFGVPKDGFVGTAEDIAREMQDWLEQEACDGFMLFESQPGQLALFGEKVAPILQERGLLRKEYSRTTLRENLGFEKPENLFVKSRVPA